MARVGYRLIAVATLLVLLSGCSAALFSSHPKQAQSWKTELVQGKGQQAVDSLEKKRESKDKALFLLESGRIAQLIGNYEASQQYFEKAAEIFQQEDEAAQIRLSEAGEGLGTLLVNDKSRHYKAPAYERIFSYTFQALNYLAEDDSDGAAVEFRRVDHEQRRQEQAHEKLIDKAEQENKGQSRVDLDRYDGYFEGLNAAASKVRSAVQNAYSYYVSAAFWEGRGRYNDALVDYKQALQINPSANFIKQDVTRVSKKLNGHTSPKGLVVVLVEQGFVPPKRPIGLPIPTTEGFVTVQFPIYSAEDIRAPYPLTLKIKRQTQRSETVAHVGNIAARALKDDLVAMIIRQAARGVSKFQLQKAANDQSPLLGLFTQIFNIISEQADLRSWLTLPANGQVARFSVSPGQQELTVGIHGRQQKVANIPVRAQGVTFVRIVDTGGRPFIQVMPVDKP